MGLKRFYALGDTDFRVSVDKRLYQLLRFLQQTSLPKSSTDHYVDSIDDALHDEPDVPLPFFLLQINDSPTFDDFLRVISHTFHW